MSTPITLLPGTLPEGYCWPGGVGGPQQYNFDIVSLIQASLNQNFPGVYVGPTSDPPPADQRDRAWINTDNQKIYQYLNGAWRTKYKFINSTTSFLGLIWTGTLANLETFDGGSAGAVSDTTGPLWVAIAAFAGRVPISNPLATTTAPGQIVDSLGNGGEYKHVLTDLEGANAQHVHPFGVSNPSSDDAFFRKVAVSATAGYTGYYITGSGPNTIGAQSTADLVTLPSGLDGAGVTSVGHNTMQPYRTCYFIERTSRVWVEPPYF